MEELKEERQAVKSALDELQVDAWVFEDDAGARSRSIRDTSIDEVREADLYVGLFWLGYGAYTALEFEEALRLGKPCLIYEKRTDIAARRSGELQEFLKQVGHVESGVTIRWIDGPEDLRQRVKEDVARWQAGIVRRRAGEGLGQLVNYVEDFEEIAFAIPKSIWRKGLKRYGAPWWSRLFLPDLFRQKKIWKRVFFTLVVLFLFAVFLGGLSNFSFTEVLTDPVLWVILGIVAISMIATGKKAAELAHSTATNLLHEILGPHLPHRPLGEAGPNPIVENWKQLEPAVVQMLEMEPGAEWAYITFREDDREFFQNVNIVLFLMASLAGSFD